MQNNFSNNVTNKQPKRRKHRFKNLIGLVFNRLTVIMFWKIGSNRSVHWKCQCICGNFAIVRGDQLKSGHTKSCGCLQKEKVSKHGKSKTREYKVWDSMIQRCTNSNDKDYDNYGGRGIRVCQGWRSSFEYFFADMGKRPSNRHSIDRKNNNLNYSCGYCKECIEERWESNCRWATTSEQGRNRRTNVKLTFSGETLISTEWAEKIGLDRGVLRDRIFKHGWSIEKTLTTPLMERFGNKPKKEIYDS